MSTIPVTIQGKSFNVAPVYAEGHELTVNEAAALDQTRRENIRNNFATKVKVANEDGTFDQETMQAELDEYAAAYIFGLRIGGGRILDPIGKTIRRLARAQVVEALKAMNTVLKDVGAKQMNHYIDGLLSKEGVEEKLRAIAEAQHEAMAELELGDLV